MAGSSPPTTVDYDEARDGHVGRRRPTPAVIVRVADEADVVAVIALARETGLDLAVRSGGHSGAGHSTADGGIVLDVRDLTSPGHRCRRAGPRGPGPGLTAAGLNDGARRRTGWPSGSAIPGRSGIGGITLGGGIGYLVRLYGMTIDSLLAAEIVTADGEVLRVDAENHPDLFWAIRGGGGNFGVATRFQFRLSRCP